MAHNLSLLLKNHLQTFARKLLATTTAKIALRFLFIAVDGCGLGPGATGQSWATLQTSTQTYFA